MARGKNFNLYLMDGKVTGRIKCTLSNWTGIVYKIPRSFLDRCKDREDLKQSGVYFLFGKNEADEDAVYIGQAGIRKNGEGVLYRVSEHLKDENFEFTEAVMLTTQNNSFGPTEISYLENKFTFLAKTIDRYAVRNANDPNPGNVTEEKESELEDFVEYSKMVLGVLGYKIFVPLVNTKKEVEERQSEELELFLKRKVQKSNKTIKAQCKRTDEGFVVLKGSMIEETDSDAIPRSIKELRQEYKDKKYIVNGELQKDILFKSPSYAAAFVLGMTTNGRTNWKSSKNITFKELEENEINEEFMERRQP